MPNCANVAATLHDHCCRHEWHGYTQGSGRWGDGEGVCVVAVDGVAYAVQQGDRDCSSSVAECWRVALQGTPYEGALDRATYTGDMRGVFVGSGLFDWHPMGDGYVAKRGDVYLNERDHTAMCQSAAPDMLSEFAINEHGGIVGGQVGDQTGRESLLRPYYDYPWDGILAYNGKADAVREPTSWDGPGVRLEGADALATCHVVAAHARPNAEHTLRAKYSSHHDAVAGMWRAGQLAARVEFAEVPLSLDWYGACGYNCYGTQRWFAMAQRDCFGAKLGDTCIVCNPDSYQDAAAAGSVSYANGWPVVYYEDAPMFWEQLGWYDRVVVVGGTAAVPELAKETARWAGDAADATMVAVAEHAFADWTTVAVANGSPDSVAACQLGVPVLPAYAAETVAALQRKRPKDIVWVGGLGAIDYDRRTALCKAAGLL